MEYSSRYQKSIESRLRAWLSDKYSPTAAILATNELTSFLRLNANLSPAEFLRPFAEIGQLEMKAV
jgi:hypothetical protein